MGVGDPHDSSARAILCILSSFLFPFPLTVSRSLSSPFFSFFFFYRETAHLSSGFACSTQPFYPMAGKAVLCLIDLSNEVISSLISMHFKLRPPRIDSAMLKE